MHVFIDESGSFAGFHDGSIAAVGALAIPDSRLSHIKRRYGKLRRKLPLERGEVKGRLLSEAQVRDVASILAREQAIFEVVVIDIGAHTKEGVAAYKAALLSEMGPRLRCFNEETQAVLGRALRQLEATPLNLFMQAIVTFSLLHEVISFVPMYFAQRRPKELAHFSWVVDGKDSTRVTNWEQWWSYYAIGALSTKSRARPGVALRGADYSYYDRSYGAREDDLDDAPEEDARGTNLQSLLSDLRFSSGSEFGLELVDVLTNGIRRALTGSLGPAGWLEIRKTMIHRSGHYISLIVLEGAGKAPTRPSYRRVVNAFRSGGRSMLTPEMLRRADLEEADAA